MRLLPETAGWAVPAGGSGVSVVVFLLLLLAAGTCLSADFRLNRILDGDTFEIVTEKGERIFVHLAGIDAPEMPMRNSGKGQPFCQKARETLADLLLNKQFSFQAQSRLVKNHVLAVVYAEGKNVNLEMIRAGLAEVYKGALPSGFDAESYKKEEREAKKREKGMWALGTVYISPSEWRKANER